MKLHFRLLVLLLLAACNNNKSKVPLEELSSSDLFEKFRKQVVLIKNKSYFKVTFDNGVKMYYTRMSESGFSDITTDEEEAKKNAEEVYGTGFFIGKKGIIATNFHVVSGVHKLLENVDFQQNVKAALEETQRELKYDISWQAAMLKQKHPEDSTYLQAIPASSLSPIDIGNDGEGEGEEDVNGPADTTTTFFHNKIDSLLGANNSMEALTSQSFTIDIVTASLTVQLDASTKDNNEYPCHIFALTQNKKVDLAVIQMDSKEIPAGVGDITDLTKDNDNEHYGTTMQQLDTLKVTTPLYLIGFNYGAEIATTSDGIKVQLSKGEVTQESDQYRVLYSVPSLPGSSGSPVFDKKGRIVAIHYSGYAVKENFNYGVLSAHLKYILEHDPVTSLP
ncbi:Trypsin-like peptidase domain-containing protein [Filimonas lacunae]|uniref:Trypsin-like peptidase domain-containing protein n=1 Tax=Filimonas lacunae TaxID=477680 RepID=A0A173MPF2_9BACT|nr:serine protease [Filimonas lacunae]BAV09522.1 protein containing heat shock protein DnaJ N-te rminal domain [Filimonas lacunae]SIS74593.1 Trypsin-like peptidase domain-containing protein [Filimonas lacunae]